MKQIGLLSDHDILEFDCKLLFRDTSCHTAPLPLHQNKDMDKYEKVLIEQALADNHPEIGDGLWHVLNDRRSALNSQFEFTNENVEKLDAINKWLCDIETKTLDHAKRVVAFLKQQHKAECNFLTDFELDYRLELWSPQKYAQCEPLEGNPFFTLHALLPNFKRYTNSENSPFDWEMDDNPDSLDWLRNDNHNEFAFNSEHPLRFQNHCWLFHELYDHTFLAWQDIMDIEEIWMEVLSRQQHISTSPLTKNTK